MNNHNNIAKDDGEPTTLTTEVLEVTGESSWCIFCGRVFGSHITVE